MRFTRRRLRYLISALLAIVVFGVIVAAAVADAPDPVDVNNLAQPPIKTATATVEVNDDETVTVTVDGGWVWPTHGSDCTDDRAGVGFAVDWNDPKQPGNPIKVITFTDPNTGQTVTEDVRVGAASATRADGLDLNPQDNVVHPTPASKEFGTADEVDVETPTQFKSWRGGCGSVTPTQPKLPRGVWGPRLLKFLGTTFGSTTGSVTTIEENGLSHTYASRKDITRICVITYDVHKGKAAKDNNGVGIPGKEKEITAGGSNRNPDNGAEKNSGTPLGNACPSIVVAGASTTSTKQSIIPNDTATVTSTDPSGQVPTGTVKFELFGPDDANCTGQVKFTQTVQLDGQGKATTTNPSANPVFVADQPGTWRWKLTYSGDGRNPSFTTACGFEQFAIFNG